MKTNKNGVKLLAAFVIMTMLVTGVVFATSESEADDNFTDITAEGFLNLFSGGAELTLNTAYKVTEPIDLTGKTITCTDVKIRFAGNVTGGTITGNGTNYISLNTDITFTGTTFSRTAGESIINPSGCNLRLVNCVVEWDNDDEAYSIYAWGAGVDITNSRINCGTIGFDNYGGNRVLKITNSTVQSISLIASQDDLNAVVGTNVIIDEVSTIKNTNLGYPENDDWGIENNNNHTLTLDIPSEKSYVTETLSGKGIVSQAEDSIFDVGSIESSNVSITTDLSSKSGIGTNILAFENDVIIIQDAYVIENLIIPEGKQIIVRNGGSLDLNNNTVTVEGKLVVETGGVIYGNGTIVLERNGIIDNSGLIGKDVPVQITASITGKNYVGIGNVSMKNASGVTFGIASTGVTSVTDDGKPIYVLTITGDVTSARAGSTISVKGVRIIGDMTIGQEVTLSTDDIAYDNKDFNVDVWTKSVLTVDGTLGATNDALIMMNNSEVVINGMAQGKIIAQTGKYRVDTPTLYNTSVDLYGIAAQTGYVTGITLSVGQISYMENSNKYIEQRLSITGTSDVVSKDSATTAPVSIITINNNTNGISIIPAESTLVIDEGIAFTGDSTTVLGQIQYPVKAGTSVSEIIGSEYIIVNADKSKTGYIMPFADAIKNIASADNTTVTVYGDVTIEDGFTLADKQKIILPASGVLTIDDDAVVELLKGSSITNKFSEVTGVLKVNTGASCAAPTKYDVLKKTTDYVEYSGLAIALENAKAGETITIKSDNTTTVENNLVVAEGVTLVVASNVTANKNITVEEGAKLVIQDNKTLTMSNAAEDTGKYALTVNGTMDASDGTITISNNEDKIYSTGELIYKTTSFGAIKGKVQGFTYDDEEGNTVVTTLANAVAKASVQDIHNDSVSAYGTVTEAEDVKLDGINLVIENNAKITLGNVSINDAQISCSAVPGGSAPEVKIGSYAATVSGLDGVGDEAADGTVKVKDYTSTIAQDNVPGASGVTTYNLTINTVAGEVEIVSGSAKLGSDYTIAPKSVLSIDEGATLLSDYASAAFSTDNAVIKIDGTLKVVKDLAITTVKDDLLVINGTLDIVGATVGISDTIKVSVLGSIVVSKAADGTAGSLSVGNNFVSVGTPIKSTGATASISGAVALGVAGNYITAYAGSDMSAAVIDGTTGYASTAYTVNGVDYATVYAKKTNEVKISDAISATGLTIDGYNATGAVWKNVEGKEVTNSDYIGSISTVDAQLTPGNAKIIYSAGTGISLWVDGIRVNSSTEPVNIALGTHTVVAKVNPGYKGDITVTFNGQKVTDGKIVITADMTKAGAANVVLSATGDITIDTGDTPAPVQPTEKDDGMGITDYLLIVLVVLAAILVVIVAIRMMRS